MGDRFRLEPGDADEPGTEDTVRHRELAAENTHVSALYRRLDSLRDRVGAQLRETQRQDASGTHQGRSERDAMETHHARRLTQLSAAEHGLCFGRLDTEDGERLYVGRIGLSDEEHEPILLDWRAPAAQGFYRATPASPQGVVRRRQLRTKGRRVVALDDDVFDRETLSDARRGTLNGEAALLASLDATRTGRMGDIVATIQGEQDRIIRADLPGVMVVQGGPGTGKTVVALHRAAYLLYTYRERLAKRGVLVVGPNSTFLRYIDEVLPSLGENDVLLSSVGRLFPGVDAVAHERPETAVVKGDLRMVEVLAEAVRERQRLPETAWELTIREGTVHEEVLRLDPALAEKAREAAREQRRPHNQARSVFVHQVIGALTRRMAGRLGQGLLRDEDVADIARELRSEPQVRAALRRLWPLLTPHQLLVDLFAAPERLAAVAPGLDEAERTALLREPPGPPPHTEPYWTPGDVPLLDEAAELLGPVETAAERLAARAASEERAEELAYAKRVLTEMGIGMVDPETLIDQHHGGSPHRPVADRARKDRTWAFGHIIVDEAQELSPMAWRVLMRRCPSRSMTVVGDIAQTGAEVGLTSWEEVLNAHAGDRWRKEELTVNYRTPAEIMDITTDVLRSIDTRLQPPLAVRRTGVPPWSLRIEPTALTGELPRLVGREIAGTGGGRLAVIVPRSRMGDLGGALVALRDVALADDPEALGMPGVVLTVEQAKGLEFDTVLVVEPEEILHESPNGIRDLYVALTRATQRLGMVHSRELPAMLAGVKEARERGYADVP
ncbi:HelD family protein [Streptomyces coffeae]|uniref:ATP-binding domain-containing protein n=1 Tax=Streptomyces coffeae TaxID=621382 RepID=A0ABS1NBN8_9ACTN|nr:ATP-binding domain-containing protein [Streptomyces coffeae]MBL1097334.1 ATP-binding domain-containing protein [Streptomyces coffeae]